MTLEERAVQLNRKFGTIGTACALALALCLALATMASAAVKIDMRVVNSAGKTLVDGRFPAATTMVKTSPKATCFGADNRGSGRSVKVSGPTPLGALAAAARKTASLRPLLITDAFDFGLGLCAIGGFAPRGKEGSWYLKINHKAASAGGDSIKVKRGDEVLWYLATSFPYPEELGLVAPRRARAGTPFRVRVFAYDEKGRRTPVAGARVNGAAGPTRADGSTTVTLRRPTVLGARHGEDIPSNRVAVCVGGKCPRG